MRNIREMEFTDGLSAEARERVRRRRMLAVAQLVLNLEPYREMIDPYSSDVAQVATKKKWEEAMVVFQKYGVALFNAEAEEIVKGARDEGMAVRQLDELTKRVTEHILGPDIDEAPVRFVQ